MKLTGQGEGFLGIRPLDFPGDAPLAFVVEPHPQGVPKQRGLGELQAAVKGFRVIPRFGHPEVFDPGVQVEYFSGPSSPEEWYRAPVAARTSQGAGQR